MTRQNTIVEKKECLKCGKLSGKLKRIDLFYLSNSPNHADGRYPICKECIKSSFNFTDDMTHNMSQEVIDSVKNVLLEMNRPFIYSVYETSVEEAIRKNKELFGIYLKNINLNFKDYNWKDSEFEPKVINEVVESTQFEIQDTVVVSNRDKDDVIRMLGYDPFEYENNEDKKHLYSDLVNFLDESTLEDGFKLQAVIEIIKGFNQINKINQAITNITNDIDKLSTNSGGIKSLIDSKKNILSSLLGLAKDNGISVNNNNNKSKGAGTLSGIIKTLQEKGFEEAEVNLFDIETAQGIIQVADLSNQSIMNQLQFDENDYTGMIIEQREIIQELDAKVMKLEEENRLLKKEIIKYQKIENAVDES